MVMDSDGLTDERTTCAIFSTYSIQEVEKHKDEKSAWTIVEGKVYDVTEFLEEHPGGKKILLKNCGKDSTELFHQYHTKKILKNVAGPMMIGQVTSEAKL
ncbi:hypothetical protein Pst134EA_007791 [Puccinia striiformis f. sp. tritici]|uniref:hypothetical protein n=1 Tax=Puccinia striiformis f. sp. tritici TaxID=168172 RepID=UPI0020088F92|nr:hypothetical protein Pst134EA_007791 [Puccinia striiformis f. sp. tritici]KAH9470542.1 hypothetical protein Pst134EA_007791 [Puccinia striiformis f. sp. tritici]